MKAVILNDYQTAAEVAQAMRNALLESTAVAVFADTELVGTLDGPGAMKEMLYERLLRRIAENPKLVDGLADRLRDNDIVD
jgi:hypothetical protein